METDDRRGFSPSASQETWTLEVVAAVSSVTGKLRAAIREARILFWEDENGVITAQVRADRVESLCVHIERWLDTEDLDACQGRLACSASGEPRRERSEPLRSLLARRRGRELLDMISENRLAVRVQPIVVLSETRRVRGHELLLRGIAASDEVVFPDRLLDAALEVDLMLELDLAARRSALAHAARHGLEGLLFVNARREAVAESETFTAQTLEAARRGGVDPGRVVIELSRHATAVPVASVVASLEASRREGFLLAIDDFGEDPDCLDLLARLRPEFVKLDRRLVRSIHRDTGKQEALDAILAECRALRVEPIALGVEKRSESDWLRARGVGLAQGYLFGVPLEIAPRDGAAPTFARGRIETR